mgnify:CR=1 FL=1|jgi:hypothetical protein
MKGKSKPVPAPKPVSLNKQIQASSQKVALSNGNATLKNSEYLTDHKCTLDNCLKMAIKKKKEPMKINYNKMF